MEWGFLLAGLFVGIMVGMTGVGGGSLMTPILIFIFHVQPAIAVGTDLLFAAKLEVSVMLNLNIYNGMRLIKRLMTSISAF